MVAQYKALWQIPGAGPSVSVMHMTTVGPTNVVAAANAIRGFFNAFALRLPNEVQVAFDSEMTIYNDATGQLSATVPVTAPANVVGTSANVYPNGAGARVDWLTPFIRNGRRVRGRTFIVPMEAGSYDGFGNVAAVARNNFVAAGANLVNVLSANASPLCVYARPTPGQAGATYNVTDVSCPPLAATLRGRKY